MCSLYGGTPTKSSHRTQLIIEGVCIFCGKYISDLGYKRALFRNGLTDAGKQIQASLDIWLNPAIYGYAIACRTCIAQGKSAVQQITKAKKRIQELKG